MTEPLYHTAGDTEDKPAAFPALDRVVLPTGSVAFTWDLEERPWLRAEYDACDLLYIEPPSRAGYLRFRSRGNVAQAGLGWSRIMKVIGSVINRPAVICGGKEVIPYLPKPTAVIERARWVPPSTTAMQVSLYGVDDRRLDPEHLVASIADLGGYQCIGDFMCGFGNSGRIFHQMGRRFVMSDMNPHCIGAIAQNCVHWPRDGQGRPGDHGRAAADQDGR